MLTTEEKIEQYLQINIDDSISAYVSDWIKWVSNYIETYTGTTFGSTNSTRYFDVKTSGPQLFIDDLTSVTSVELLDQDGDTSFTLTENDDFWLYPLNRETKNEIRLNPYGDYPNFPYIGSKRVKVIGSFGVGTTVPGQIEMVATQMVGDLIKQSCGEAKGKKSEQLGEYSVTFEDIGKYSVPYTNILDLYRCPTL
jgi:hypothetical protein